MNEYSLALVLSVCYKVASLMVGLAFGYMGYRLFLADKMKAAGNMEVRHEVFRLKLGGAAPGTFFSLFGAAIIIVTVMRGWEYQRPPEAPIVLPSKDPLANQPKAPPGSK